MAVAKGKAKIEYNGVSLGEYELEGPVLGDSEQESTPIRGREWTLALSGVWARSFWPVYVQMSRTFGNLKALDQ